jgi:hypothetical protein
MPSNAHNLTWTGKTERLALNDETPMAVANQIRRFFDGTRLVPLLMSSRVD